MTEEEIEARATMIALLPAQSKTRYEQEQRFVIELIGPAPRAAGKLATDWWQELRHPNHALLPTVLRGIRTREPEQAMRILQTLSEPVKRKALCGWLGSLDYATETETLLALLQQFQLITWQPKDDTLVIFEEVLEGIRFLEPETRSELANALNAAIEVLPHSERQQKLRLSVSQLGV